MNSYASLQLEIPTDLKDEIIPRLRADDVSIEPIHDKGGLKSAMVFFEITVGLSTLVATGLQIYEFLRDRKKKMNQSNPVILETKPGTEVNITIRVEINPNIPKPVIRDALLNMQAQLSLGNI